MHNETSFVPLLIVVSLAFFVPLLLGRFKRLRLPIVVGEIMAGIIVGESGLKLVGHDPTLDILSLLGFAYLMFLSGLEIDFDTLLPRRGTEPSGSSEGQRSPLLLAGTSFGLTTLLAFGAAWLLHWLDRADDPWLMTLILSTTSLGLVVPVLKEHNLTGGPFGQLVLIASVVADFVTMLLVSVYVLLHTRGLTLEVMFVLLLFGAFGTAYRLARAARPQFVGMDLFQRISNATAQIDVRGAFAVALGFIALAQGLGIEIILGAFLGGALISLLADRKRSDLHHRLDVIGYAFFVPIFFIMVGVGFDLQSVLDSRETLLLVPLLLILAYLIKLLAAAVFRANHTWRETLSAGVLLSSRLSLVIAISAVGLELEVIDQATNSAIILMAIVSCTASPILFSRLVPSVDRTTPDPLLVIGDRQALSLAQRLMAHGDPVILGTLEALPVDGDELGGVRLARLDEISGPALAKIGASRAKTLLALLPDDAANLKLCQVASAAFRIPNMVAQVQDPANSEAFATIGVQPITRQESQAIVLENLAATPNIFRLLSTPSDDQEVIEVRVANPALDGTPVHELRMPREAMIMMIERAGSFIAPRGDTRLELGDTVTILASVDEAVEICRLFECT